MPYALVARALCVAIAFRAHAPIAVHSPIVCSWTLTCCMSVFIARERDTRASGPGLTPLLTLSTDRARVSLAITEAIIAIRPASVHAARKQAACAVGALVAAQWLLAVATKCTTSPVALAIAVHTGGVTRIIRQTRAWSPLARSSGVLAAQGCSMCSTKEACDKYGHHHFGRHLRN